MLTQTYNIDMIPSGVPLALHISQYDVGLTTFVFTPFVSVGTMDFSVVTEAYLEATKPDMTAIVHACTVGNGTITYTVQEQLAAVSGRVYSKLVLKDASSDVVASKAILWLVEPAGVADDAILSDSDLSGVSQVIQASTNFNDAVPTQTVTGEVLTFDDAVGGAPLQNLILHIEPYQSGSGDPSPSNIRPISGYDAVNVTRCGKNLWSLSASYTSTAAKYFEENKALILPSGSYTLSYTPSITTGQIVFAFKKADNSTILSITINNSAHKYNFTLNEDCANVSVYTNSALTISNVMIESGSTVTAYEPYTAQTYPISLASAGTVYGGTLDVTTGELVVDREILTFDGSPDENWVAWSSGKAYYIVSTSFVSDTNMICDSYAWKGRTWSAEQVSAFSVGSFTQYTNNNICFRYDDTGTNLTAFKAALAESPIHVVIRRATELHYMLTPTEVTTLLGENTIWMDAEGTIDASYKVRLSSYFMALRTMLAPVEASYTATANYVVGDYLIVGTVLYKVTSAITSGETIAEGSNVTATTVMAEIKALQ